MHGWVRETGHTGVWRGGRRLALQVQGEAETPERGWARAHTIDGPTCHPARESRVGERTLLSVGAYFEPKVRRGALILFFVRLDWTQLELAEITSRNLVRSSC